MEDDFLIVKVADRLSRFAATASVALLAYLTFHFLVEIVLRAAFNRSTYLLAEFAGYTMAAMTCLGLGNALRERELIRVSLLQNLLRSRPVIVQQAVEVFCCLLALFATAFVIYAFALGAIRNFELGVTSYTNFRMPLWIPETILLVGLAIFKIQLISYTIVQIAVGISGKDRA